MYRRTRDPLAIVGFLVCTYQTILTIHCIQYIMYRLRTFSQAAVRKSRAVNEKVQGSHAKIFGSTKSAAYDRRSTSDLHL